MPSNTPHRRRRVPGRRLAGAAVAGLLALGGTTVLAAPALAHDQLLSTSPEDGATVSAAPSEVTLSFSGNLITGQGIQNVLTVTDEAGHQWQDGRAQVSGPELTAPLCEGLPNGDYDVAYRVVYSDGHSEAKEYSFTLEDPQAPEAGAPQDCGVPNPDAPVSDDAGDNQEPAATASAPPTLGTPTPGSDEPAGDAGGDEQDPAAQPEASGESAEAGGSTVPAWVWGAGILAVLAVAAAVTVVFRRARAIDGPTDNPTDSPADDAGDPDARG